MRWLVLSSIWTTGARSFVCNIKTGTTSECFALFFTCIETEFCFLGSEGKDKKYFVILKVTNNIGQDAVLFSSDNQAPNGMTVKTGSSLMILKTMVSSSPVSFTALDATTKARIYLNNMGKFKVQPSHSHHDITDVTLMPSGEWLRCRWMRMFKVGGHARHLNLHHI